MSSEPLHPDLHSIRASLGSIYESLSNFRPLAVRPPILGTSTESSGPDPADDEQWLYQESISGLKQLKDTVKIDLDFLERFLDNPNSAKLPPPSTNAPYLTAVWNEVLCAPPPLVSIFKSFSLANDSSSNHTSKTTVKVDVVADSGRRWIRVNTIKNKRILAEFREIDSYLTDSDDDEDDPEQPPTLAQSEFGNSVLRMGHSLVEAAKANPIETSAGPEPPRVTLRLTRLNPLEPGEDPRIAQTIECLRGMGIDVELGERIESEIPSLQLATEPIPLARLVPTVNINLDLSVLIAFVSDLTHYPLPTSVEDAHLRFMSAHTPGDSARELTSQILREMLQEMGNKGMFQELHDRLPLIPPGVQTLQFWTSAEARDRFMRIVSKIGGPDEKQRADVLFASSAVTIETAETRFWAGSRFPHRFIPFLPIRVYPEDCPVSSSARGQFFSAMDKTCRDILAQGLPAAVVSKGQEHSERATVTRANTRLTAHTVQSMLCGAQRGWTTLTANKSSVKALLREIRAARVAGRLAEEALREDEVDLHGEEAAAIWIVDPRSLAEGICRWSPALATSRNILEDCLGEQQRTLIES
ncbi:hypothetical protein GGX14DRAFT_605561 [Mycena pura]|uniref:DUF1308 domain-containing protein n=1 Tax=Mycena pura TaxID=153505 RepID=A0AAD6VQC8_9AGAR|nr:hypothetical protein GGX14DRAFT_605561 [Mycena pura]